MTGFATSAALVPNVVVAAVPVRALFTGDFRFQLPWFQRAYAWTPAQIAFLASSVREAMAAQLHYPLGTLILARAPGSIDTALVDGHQRLMTLTILFSVLRDLEPDEAHRAALDALIADPNAPERASAYRLTPLADATRLLASCVQAPGSTTLAPEADWVDLSMNERHIIENRDWLRSEALRTMPDSAQRRAFAAHVLDRCWVIVHIADDEDEAWRRLRLDEDTRLAFDEENRAKATMLSLIPREDRQEAADGWARCEQLLTADDIVALLGHLRQLYVGPKRKKAPVEVDIVQHFDLRHRGLAFIEETLLPAARTMRALKLATIDCVGAHRSLNSLAWLDQDLWMTSALSWQSRRAADTAETADFYFRLERLMWIMRIGGMDPARQSRRLLRILDHVRSDLPIAECVDTGIEKPLIADAVAALRAPKLGMRRFLAALLRRLSLTLGNDPGPIDPRRVTVEHLLPRNPKRGSGWNRIFGSREQVNAYAYRLGNLTLMTDKENQAAGSHDWPVKRQVLAATNFSLSAGLADSATWDAAAIDQRTERLIAALFAEWRLPVS